MIRRHPAMLAALMLCALPSREPTPEERRTRGELGTKRQRKARRR